MSNRGLGRFDLVLIDGEAPADFEDREALTGAGMVLIDRMDTQRNQLIAHRLLQPGSGYELMSSHPERNGGYTAFRRPDVAGEVRPAEVVRRPSPRPAPA
jgi:hypothetical protein